jgi:prepilin-type N-terminal cleavage/methylation domain-containing protein
MKNRRGFTLIEMLAVVTIIGLLAGLIITRISRSIADSKKTASLANANLLVGAFEDYYMQAKARGAFNGCSYDFGGNSNTCTGFSFTGAQPDEGLITLSSTGSVDGDLVFGDYSYAVDGGSVSVAVELADPVFDFDYVSVGNDKEQYFIAPATGYYKLEVWGASGGSISNVSSQWGNLDYSGGYGGYSSGVVRLTSGSFIFIDVGGQGTSVNGGTYNSFDSAIGRSGGYNGGGDGRSNSHMPGCGGGGATHIALSRGTLASFDADLDGIADSDEIGDILIVAGGGGGAAFNSLGAAGGGKVGVTAYISSGSTSPGGSQESGNAFGQGGNGRSGPCTGDNNCEGGGGAGGGFYGGYATTDTGLRSNNGGGGGSGYIGNSQLSNGVMYCYGCAEDNTSGIKTIDSNGTNKDSNCPNGYSTTAISNCAKSGDGHARVTFIGRTLD